MIITSVIYTDKYIHNLSQNKVAIIHQKVRHFAKLSLVKISKSFSSLSKILDLSKFVWILFQFVNVGKTTQLTCSFEARMAHFLSNKKNNVCFKSERANFCLWEICHFLLKFNTHICYFPRPTSISTKLYTFLIQ